MSLKKGPKIALFALLIASTAFAVNKYIINGSKVVGKSQEISSGQLGTAAESPMVKTTDTHLDLPKVDASSPGGTRMDFWGMAWNGQIGLAYAMAGTTTAKGSLFEKAGIDGKFVWQDDCDKTIAAFIANANDIKKDPNTVPVVMLLMGDGMMGFTASLKDLKKLGKDYKPIVVGFCGRSDGEDGFWGPSEWKKNPKACLGHTVCFKLLDGDGNDPIKWCADNNIPFNPNPKYLDSGALNVIPAQDYVDAGNKYISGYTEQRTVIKNGKTTSTKVTVGVDAYASWTPVDVTVAEKKGGLVRIVSTHEYTAQMPCAIVILKAWAYASSEHQTAVKNMLKALGQAGDQVRSFPDALDLAGKVEAEWYGNQSDKPGSYWVKYYKGTEEKDATGVRVPLGGSKAFNLADCANMMGKGKDGIDRYKMTYNYFGTQLQKLWPKEMQGMEQYQDVIDKSFVSSVLDNNDDLAQGKTEEDVTPTTTGDITDEVSSKPYQIQFELGKAVVKLESKKQIAEIFQSKVISGGLRIGVYGHTDNIGNPDANQELSERRAEAVAQYLIQLGIKPKCIVTKGYGDKAPIEGTDASDPVNRAVEIVQGT